MNIVVSVLVFCFFICNVKAQQYEFGFSTGGSYTEEGKSIGKDALGNIYVVGRFNGTQDFDPGVGVVNLTANGANSDAFILKYDSLGALLWAKSFGGTGYEIINDIAVGSNEFVITGRFESTVDFDPNIGTANKTSAGGYDLFIAKYDLNGNFSWVVNFGGASSDDVGNDVELDAGANIYLCGLTKNANVNPLGSLSILSTNSSSEDMVVAKYNSSGILTWAKSFGSVANGEDAKSIEITSTNQLVIAGEFRNTVDFDPGAGTSNLTSAGNADVVLLWLNSGDGSYVLAKKYGGANLDIVTEIDIDNSDNVFTTGYFQGTSNFSTTGTSELTTVTFDPDAYFAKYSSSGNLNWVNQIGGQYDDRGVKLEIGNAGDVYVTGDFSDFIDFDPSPTGNYILDGQNANIYLAKYTTNGSIVYAYTFGTAQPDYAGDIYLDNVESIFMTGSITNSVNMNPSGSNILGQSYQDYFLVKYSQCTSPPLVFTTQPLNDTVCQNSTVLFTALFTGGQAACQWQKSINGTSWSDISDNIYYSGVNNDSLFIVGDMSIDNLYYRCVITNCTSFYSDSARLNVNPSPNVNGYSSGGTICFGDTLYFDSDGADVLQWSNGIIDSVAYIPSLIGTNAFSLIGTDLATNCSLQLIYYVEVLDNPSIVLNLNPVVICEGDSIFIDATNADVFNWSNGAVEETYFTPSVGSFYLVCEGIDMNGCKDKDSSLILVNNTPSVFAGNDTLVCSGTPLFFSGSGASSYLWSNGIINNQSTIITANSVFVLTGTDGNGCSNADTLNVTSTSVPTPEICMVTVDDPGNNNLIFWDKTNYAMADTFFVYREITNNNYQIIGKVPYNSLSQFIDTVRVQYFPNTGNPRQSAYKYKLSIKDTCGNEGTLSLFHKTLFLQDNTGNFIWNHYEIEGQAIPVPQLVDYLFLRDNDLDGIFETTIASTTSNAFTDGAYATFQNTADWRIHSNWTIACTPTMRLANSGHDETQTTVIKSKSNIKNNRTTGIQDSKIQDARLKIYPNPANEMLNVELLILNGAQATITIENMLGQVVYSQQTNQQINKINTSLFVSGVYFVKVNTGKGIVVEKVIID